MTTDLIDTKFIDLFQKEGSEVVLDQSERGGQCGVWVDRDGTLAVEMQTEHLEVLA